MRFEKLDQTELYFLHSTPPPPPPPPAHWGHLGNCREQIEFFTKLRKYLNTTQLDCSTCTSGLEKVFILKFAWFCALGGPWGPHVLFEQTLNPLLLGMIPAIKFDSNPINAF